MSVNTFRLGLLAIMLLAGSLAAQTTIYVPDPNPQVPGGTAVNTIPFSSSAYTYMGVIPAASLDPQNTRILDISFAPSGSGTWNAASALIGIGHVPNPLPCQFNFPGPGAATVGDFTDFTVMFDTSVHGSLNWVWPGQTWAPMGIDTAGGASFEWNGVDDIGVYVTFTGSTTFSGCYRNNASGPPLRTYASSYQAAASTTCQSNFGLVIALKAEPGINELTVTSNAQNNLVITLDQISPTATEGYLLLSTATGLPQGQGPIFGIEPNSVTWFFLFNSPLADGSPFHFPVPSTLGLWPNIPFALPNGSTAGLVGTTMDFVTVLFKAGGTYDSRSNVARITF